MMNKSLLLVVSAVVVLVLFGITFKNSLTATVRGVPTVAECTQIEKTTKRTSRRRGFRLRFKSYHFRFTDEDGEPQRATIDYGAFWIQPQKGDSVPIIYVKDSPSLTYYDSVLHVWMFPGIFGGLLLAMGAKRLFKLGRGAGAEG